MVVCCHFTNLSQTALMVAISSSRVLGTACSHTSNDKAVVCLVYIGAPHLSPYRALMRKVCMSCNRHELPFAVQTLPITLL
jgi:hypothetical protein